MRPVLVLAALAVAPLFADGPVPGVPYYTADTITNSAAAVAGSYAPNTFVTISGQNLAYVTRAITTADIAANTLPTALGGTGVRVLINALPAYLWYVSPTQVYLLIPSLLTPGSATIQLEVNGVAGPEVQILLSATAPGLFLYPDGMTVIAQHVDYSLVTADAPAHAGELVILYAGGLGQTSPVVPSGQIPQVAAQIKDKSSFKVWLNGVAVDSSRIEYVGITPTTAGLYQINLRLPDGVPPNPEIRISTGDVLSPAQRYLALQ